MQFEPILEVLRWGMAHIPAVLYTYSAELDLDIEDIGMLGMVLFAHQKTKPLSSPGVELAQVMRVCPAVSKNRLARRLGKWEKAGLIKIEDQGMEFAARRVCLDPLYNRLRDIILRDHPLSQNTYLNTDNSSKAQEKRIEELELALQREQRRNGSSISEVPGVNNRDFRMVADFISQKTGNLISIKMGNELRKWMTEFCFKPEFILCFLELCFERRINNPHEITKIAAGLKECSICNLEAMETYFHTFVDDKPSGIYEFDPEVVEFGRLTGLDMKAEARKKVYYKWRYDWGFSNEMVSRAGEIMCNRTKNGGIDYVDGILSNWKNNNVRSLADAEKETAEHKSRRKAEKQFAKGKKPIEEEEREIYLPPGMIRSDTAASK